MRFSQIFQIEKEKKNVFCLFFVFILIKQTFSILDALSRRVEKFSTLLQLLTLANIDWSN